jgi:hypothetical protein
MGAKVYCKALELLRGRRDTVKVFFFFEVVNARCYVMCFFTPLFAMNLASAPVTLWLCSVFTNRSSRIMKKS